MLTLITCWPQSTTSLLGDTPLIPHLPLPPPKKKTNSAEGLIPCCGDFNVYHKDWLTYSGGTDRPGELCSNPK